MKRRDFLRRATGAVLAAMPGVLRAAPTPTPSGAGVPNIVLIVTDQTRADVTRRAGYPLDTMPAADALAARGISFTNAYCTMPACMPSRVSLLTGRWPQAHRVRTNFLAREAVYDADLYQVARARGYRTGLCGKNHTYLTATDVDYWRDYGHDSGPKDARSSPDSAAFERWLKALDFNVALEPTPFALEAQLPYRIASDAIDFVRAGDGRPFLLQVSFPEPHDPEQVPRPYWDMFPPDGLPPRAAGPEALAHLGYRAQWLDRLAKDGFPATETQWRRYVSNYLGALRMVDDQIKRLIDHLSAAALFENTVFVRIADHGDYLMDYGLARKGVGLSEALTRVPMTWTGPGIKPSRAVGETAFASVADVMPTLCEVMGAPIPPGVQGRSLLPLLRGEAYLADEFRSIVAQVGLGGLYVDAADAVPVSVARGGGGNWDELNGVTQSGNAHMVRMGTWKLVYDMMGYGQLYDLAADPHELQNLFGQSRHATEQARMMAELAMWVIRNQDSLPTGPQNRKYRSKWARPHNWYAPFRHGHAPSAFIP